MVVSRQFALGNRDHVVKTTIVARCVPAPASLPAVLGELAKTRNPAAHTTRVGREEATELRARLVGVGCEGELVRLAKVRVL